MTGTGARSGWGRFRHCWMLDVGWKPQLRSGLLGTKQFRSSLDATAIGTMAISLRSLTRPRPLAGAASIDTTRPRARRRQPRNGRYRLPTIDKTVAAIVEPVPAASDVCTEILSIHSLTS